MCFDESSREKDESVIQGDIVSEASGARTGALDGLDLETTVDVGGRATRSREDCWLWTC